MVLVLVVVGAGRGAGGRVTLPQVSYTVQVISLRDRETGPLPAVSKAEEEQNSAAVSPSSLTSTGGEEILRCTVTVCLDRPVSQVSWVLV